MLENTPAQSTMTELLGQPLLEVWQELCSVIEEKYNMERLWNTGWTYEYKYRRGGKTLCRRYDEAQTYRDGKWVMFEPTDTSEFDDYIKLLAIKRKPNRKE